jgi:hypothetical protein
LGLIGIGFLRRFFLAGFAAADIGSSIPQQFPAGIKKRKIKKREIKKDKAWPRTNATVANQESDSHHSRYSAAK